MWNIRTNSDVLVLFLSLILKGAECGWGCGVCVWLFYPMLYPVYTVTPCGGLLKSEGLMQGCSEFYCGLSKCFCALSYVDNFSAALNHADLLVRLVCWFQRMFVCHLVRLGDQLKPTKNQHKCSMQLCNCIFRSTFFLSV